MILLALLALACSVVLGSAPPSIQPYCLITILLQDIGVSNDNMTLFNQQYRRVLDAMAGEPASTGAKHSSAKSLMAGLLEFKDRLLVMAKSDAPGLANNLSNLITSDLFFCKFERQSGADFLAEGNVEAFKIPAFVRSEAKCFEFVCELKRLVGCMITMTRLKSPDPQRLILRLQSLVFYLLPMFDNETARQFNSITEQYFGEYFLMLETLRLKGAAKTLPKERAVCLSPPKEEPVAEDYEDYLFLCIRVHLDVLHNKQRPITARMRDLIAKGAELRIPSYNYLFANYPRFGEHRKADGDRITAWCQEYESLLDDVGAAIKNPRIALPKYHIKLSTVLRKTKGLSVRQTVELVEKPSLAQLRKAKGVAFGMPLPICKIFDQESAKMDGCCRQEFDCLSQGVQLYQSVVSIGIQFGTVMVSVAEIHNHHHHGSLEWRTVAHQRAHQRVSALAVHGWAWREHFRICL